MFSMMWELHFYVEIGWNSCFAGIRIITPIIVLRRVFIIFIFTTDDIVSNPVLM